MSKSSREGLTDLVVGAVRGNFGGHVEDACVLEVLLLFVEVLGEELVDVPATVV
jgi:hypothetical protein